MRFVPNRIVVVGLIAMVGTGFAAPARAQMDSREGIALQNQILELRRDMQVLRDQLSRNPGAAPSPAYRRRRSCRAAAATATSPPPC